MSNDEQTRSRSSEAAIRDLKESIAKRETREQEIKREALAAGKEPFDLDRFDELYTGVNSIYYNYKRTGSREERIKRWERGYYAGLGRDTWTLEEFAELQDYHDLHDWT
jgi:hypothetical protein